MNAKIIEQLQNEFKDMFTGICCFDGLFSLHVKVSSKPYDVPPRCVAYAPQKTFKEVTRKATAARFNHTLGKDETVE